MSTYNRFPHIEISKQDKISRSIDELVSKLENESHIIMELYPGSDVERIRKEILSKFKDHELIFIDDYSKDHETIKHMTRRTITDDRVFGYMTNYKISDFYEQNKIEELKDKFKVKKVVFYGFGASMLYNSQSKLVYFNLARWEIQKRFRAGMANWKANNEDEDILRKFKRGYFFEWRVADKIKKEYHQKIDYLVDFNNEFKYINGEDYLNAIKEVINKPFRLVPYFDSGVWGGQWMKENLGLEDNGSNYAWSFDGVVEENSIYLKFGSDYVEVPAIDVVFYEPIGLLGEKVYGRFGTEFPIRFDFLDTIQGQNLSLQVHPTTEYIQENFGMNYTQDESYYILDTKEDSDTYVYLGMKSGVSKEQFINALKDSQNGKTFDADKYVNKIECKKHDHFLIPAGTVHCSGKDVMVLEISSTPYIFTFKLWDWDRLGMDGKPRPINIEHGKEVIDFDRDTKVVNEELVNNFEKISDVEEKTGLHKREFIKTIRLSLKEPFTIKLEDNFNMLNLVEGSKLKVSSPNGKFEDYIINYAETFIIPANVKEYTLTPYECEEVKVIKASVR